MSYWICDKDQNCIDCPKHYPEETCEHWIEVEPVKDIHTNGDRIRVMTDEELGKCGGITQNRPDKEPTEGQVYFDKQNKKDYKYKNGKWVETPRTNADRIRSMTDEELAMIVCCQNNKTGDDCFNESCYNCTLDWLKQEV